MKKSTVKREKHVINIVTTSINADYKGTNVEVLGEIVLTKESDSPEELKDLQNVILSTNNMLKLLKMIPRSSTKETITRFAEILVNMIEQSTVIDPMVYINTLQEELDSQLFFNDCVSLEMPEKEYTRV